MNKKLNILPKLLSSKISIYIYVFLFFTYLLLQFIQYNSNNRRLKPTDATQLVLGNYTNVLSAQGASIAVGTGVVVHTKVAQIQKNHETLKKPHYEMKDLLEKLHSKLDTCYVLFKN